jgi:hypothetical protein
MSNFSVLSAAWKASDSIRYIIFDYRDELTSGSGSPSPMDQSIFDVITFRAIVLDFTVLPANGLKADTARGSRSRTAAAFIVVKIVRDRAKDFVINSMKKVEIFRAQLTLCFATLL